MAIERTVETDVYCDVCDEWIMGWKSNDVGVSRAWAAEYTRRRGGTVGKKIVCKKCRIKERIRTCSIQRKIGNAGRDSDGTCMGFASVVSDEPMERCKRCIACTSYRWNLKPDILIHGSPCQDFSIAGHQRGADEGSETRSSLMWETIHIIDQMGEWKPKYVIWENVKNVTSKHMIANFVRYQKEMERMGYTNNYDVLDAREFGLPQARERVFTISCLNGEKFDFTSLIRTPMRKISEFLEDNKNVPEVYNVTQPSVYNVIGASGIKRATVIKDFAYTITTRQDRTPAQVIDCGSGRYRYLTERECWRLMGYTDEEFEAAKAVHERKGRYYMTLYKQAGNSIAVPIFESIFRKIILGEEKTKKDDSERQEGDAGR